jgi:hypothetical protein
MKTHPVIVSRKVDDLIPYARNSRTHSDAQVAQIAASVREFGWTNPVLVDGENGIIAGHGRVLAARKLGMEEVPCIELAGLSDTQRRAYIIADNKLALNGGWDDELLALEISELDAAGFDLSVVGFSQGELTSLFLEREEGETDPETEWKGMPEFDQKDSTSWRKLIVHFECQSDFDEFSRLIGQKMTGKTSSIWHPKKENMDTDTRRYG